MKLHRFFVTTGFVRGELRIADLELVHQMRDVLKLHPGESCILFNATEQEAQVTVIEYAENELIVSVDEILKKREEKIKIVLYCAVLKRENFEFVVQKVTELGVTEIVPIITQRTIKTGLKQERLEKIATEATEQSGHIGIPSIQKPMSFFDALHRAQDHDKVFVLHTEKSGNENDTLFPAKTHMSIGIFIGPEGGFTLEEIQKAKEYSYNIHTFPDMVLRAETAAIVGVFWARNLLSS